MKVNKNRIDEDFTNSILFKYLDKVIESQPLTDVIPELSFRLQTFDEESGNIESTITAIDVDKLEYIMLVTKLTTMIEVFKQLKGDDNIVMVDIMEEELVKFQEVMEESIIKTNDRLLNT